MKSRSWERASLNGLIQLGRPRNLFAALLVTLAIAYAPAARAGGVVSVCDETHLRAALAGGGTVTFTCSGTITVTAANGGCDPQKFHRRLKPHSFGPKKAILGCRPAILYRS